MAGPAGKPPETGARPETGRRSFPLLHVLSLAPKWLKSQPCRGSPAQGRHEPYVRLVILCPLGIFVLIPLLALGTAPPNGVIGLLILVAVAGAPDRHDR